METPLAAAEMTSNPVNSPERLVNNITHSRDWLIFGSVVALAFFALYAYKTWLEVKVAKQEFVLNKELIKDYAEEQSGEQT
jgi:hypothetical protein